MGKSQRPQPTEAELAILRVLWQRGPSTVRDVHEALGGGRQTRYTTTLKQLQVMTDKQLVNRDASQRSHIYSATIDENSTEQSLVKDFIDRVFDGSTRKMVLHALGSRQVSDDELTEIRQLIQRLEKR